MENLLNTAPNSTFRKTIIVGDVHGCLEELKELLVKVDFQQGLDRLIFAGDLVDRGPDSAGVVKYVRALKAEAVMGNHESKLLRRWRHIQRAKTNPKYRNPMKRSVDQEKTISALDHDDLVWLDRLPYFIDLPDLNALVVHAGLAPGVPVARQAREVLTMVRYIDYDRMIMVPLQVPGFTQPPNSFYWAEAYDGHRNVIFGHNVVGDDTKTWQGIENGVRCWGIDTGCVFGGNLTACVFSKDASEPTFISVRAHSNYSKRFAE